MSLLRISSAFLIILALSLSTLVWLSAEVAQSDLTFSVFVTLIMIISVWLGGSIWKPSHKTDPFHPALLFSLFAMVYIGLSSGIIWLMHDYNSTWFDLGNNRITLFNKAICLSILACFFYGMGLRFPIWFDGSRIAESSSKASDINDSKSIQLIAYIFFIFGFMATAYTLLLYGSENWILYLSPRARRDSGVGVSQLVQVIMSMLAWSAILFIILMIRTKIRLLPLILVVIAILMVYVSSAKRTTVLPILLIPLIYYHYCHNWLSLLKAFRYFIGLIFLLVIGVLARMALPLVARGATPSDHMGQNTQTVLEFYAVSGEFMTFDMFLFSQTRAEIILEQIGGALEGFIYYTFAIMAVIIPRALWPGKPDFWDLGNVYNTLITGGEGVGFAITIFGTSYLFLGIIGLTFGMFLFAWIQKIIYQWLKPYNGDITNVLYYGVVYWMAFQAMRFGTFGFTFVVFIQTMLVGFLAIWLLGKMRKFNFSLFPSHSQT